jgi:putative permease
MIRARRRAVSLLRGFRGDRQLVILLLIVAAAATLLVFAAGVLAPVLASAVIAWMLETVAQRLERLGLSRALAASVLTAVFVTALALFLFLLAPLLLGQIAQLARQLPGMVSGVQTLLLGLPDLYPELLDRGQIVGLVAELNADAVILGQTMLRASVAQLPTLATIGIYLFILPLLVFFFIRDGRLIMAWLGGFLPENRPLADEAWREIVLKMGGYVRGRVYEMLIVGVVCYLAFEALDLDFAALLAALAGASVLIPYFGAPLVAVPVALTAFAQWGFGPEFIWTLATYTVIQTIDGAILGTLLLAGTVNLHPVAVMVAVLVFGDLFGFWGLFFAVPMASVLQVVLDVGRRRRAG